MKARIITGVLIIVMPFAVICGGTAASGQTSTLNRIHPQTPQQLQQLLRYTARPMHFVSAHRGGCGPGLPENCMATFERTLEHTFAIIEIDPRYTKDGKVVIHHDPALDRTTTGTGPIREKTLEQLRQLRLKDPEGNITEQRIPTLDEVLEWARGKTILVLDQKDVPVEIRARKVAEHHAESYVIMIVYSVRNARKCYELNNNIMMEVMIGDRDKFREFDESGLPWSNIVAFVGHTTPDDAELLRMIHERGACCMAGTSRNLDRQLIRLDGADAADIQHRYHALLHSGVDIIETDLPREVGKILYGESPLPQSMSSMFIERQ